MRRQSQNVQSNEYTFVSTKYNKEINKDRYQETDVYNEANNKISACNTEAARRVKSKMNVMSVTSQCEARLEVVKTC